MSFSDEDFAWERSRQFVPNKRESALRLSRWRKLRRRLRRRKSPVAYWWGPAILLSLTLAGFIATAVKLTYTPPVAKALPEPGLYVVYATAERVEQFRREENVRRQAMALSDEEVGISLDAALPDPLLLPKRQVALEQVETRARETCVVMPAEAYLPKMREPAALAQEVTTIVWAPDAALKASQFTMTLPYIQEEAIFEEARFYVILNESGHVIEVLRFAPAGEETALLRHLREALLKGGGTSAAQGEVRIFWKTRLK